MAGWSVPGMAQLKEVRADPVGRRFLARHHITRRLLEITYLSPELLADTEFRTRFGDEFARLARLREARVARVHRYVESDHGAAVIADHVSGTSVRALLAAQGAVGTAAALVVLKDLLLGLAACHDAGLAHGDVKPEDVILTPAGRVRLIDLGLWTSESRRLLSWSTPFYLAPELRNGPAVSEAGDVYAATVTFFECLAGAPPFYANGVRELSAKHVSGIPPVEVVPESVRELVSRGLDKDPGSRPDARAMLALVGVVAPRAVGSDWERQGRRELVALLAGRSVLPEMPVPTRQGGGAGRRYDKPVRLAAVMGAALVLAAGLSSPPLAVLPGISIFGSGGRPPVLAFPDPDRGAVAVRVMTNGPLADRAPGAAAKGGTAGPVAGARSQAPSIARPSIHTAPYEHAVPDGLGQGAAHPDGAAPHQSAPDASTPALPAVNPVQPRPDSAGSTSDPSGSVPMSLPILLPLPMQLPLPVSVPVPSPIPVKVPAQLPEPVKPPVQAFKPIPSRDKTGPRKDVHIRKDFQVQQDSPRSRTTRRAARPDSSGASGGHSTNQPRRGHGHFTGTGTGNSGNR